MKNQLNASGGMPYHIVKFTFMVVNNTVAYSPSHDFQHSDFTSTRKLTYITEKHSNNS